MSTPAQFSGEAEFLFEGSAYRLTIDNMALLEAERVLGESMMDWAPQLVAAFETGRNPLMSHLSALVAGALRINHPEFTQKLVVSIAMGYHGEDSRRSLTQAVFEALDGLDVSDLSEGEVGNAPAPAANRQQRRAKAKAGTGTKSSGSGAKQASKRKPSGGKPRAARS